MRVSSSGRCRRTDAALEQRKGFQQSKKKSMLWVVTNKPLLSSLIQGWLLNLWGQCSIITVQTECVLIQLRQRSEAEYLSMHTLSQMMKWIKLCRVIHWCLQCVLVSAYFLQGDCSGKQMNPQTLLHTIFLQFPDLIFGIVLPRPLSGNNCKVWRYCTVCQKVIGVASIHQFHW